MSEQGFCEGDEQRPGHTEFGSNRVGDVVLCDACLEADNGSEYLERIAAALVKHAGHTRAQVRAVLPILVAAGQLSPNQVRAAHPSGKSDANRALDEIQAAIVRSTTLPHRQLADIGIVLESTGRSVK